MPPTDRRSRLTLIGTITKPSIGIKPGQTTAQVKTLAEAEIDFIKDDELMAKPTAPAVRQTRGRPHAHHHCARPTQRRKVMYVFNVSDELDAMLRHYEKVVSAGGACAMIPTCAPSSRV